jgi:hypothetical protein
LLTVQRVELFVDLFSSFAFRMNQSSFSSSSTITASSSSSTPDFIGAAGVCLIATARASSTLHASLQLPPLFSTTYDLPAPNASGRTAILDKMLSARGFVSDRTSLALMVCLV